MNAPNSKYHAIISEFTQLISDRSVVNGNKHAAAMLREAKRLENAVHSLADIYNRQSPTVTDAAHYKKVSLHAKRLDKEVKDAQERIMNLQVQAANDVEQRLTDRLNLVADQHGAELRAALRSMSNKERHNTIRQIMESGDGPSMAAITKAPAVLSGIPTDIQAKYSESYEKTHAADVFRERDQLFNTIADLATITGTAERAANGFLDPERLRSIEEGERVAGEAENAFQSALATGAEADS